MINFENIRNFAYVNNHRITGEVKGICLFFMGLTSSKMFDEKWDGEDDFQIKRGKKLAENGIVYIIPYLNPWNWMNDNAIKTTNEIIAAVIEGMNLKKDIPVCSTGDSMGGLCSLVYSYYSAHNIVSCIPNCPVCDFVYHLTERFDLPRTIYDAYRDCTDFDLALRQHSPLHLADRMPDIEYHLFHCSKDSAVNIDMHTMKLFSALKEGGKNVTLDIAEGRDHCDLTEELLLKFEDYVISSLSAK